MKCPHPFTGVSGPITSAFVEVGKLIRRQRQLARSQAFASQKHIDELQSMLSKATILEESVLSQNVPQEQHIANPQDQDTPVEHLIKMAESYRDAALLQLYRVFPDLLSRRLGDGKPNHAGNEDLTAVVANDCLLALALRILDTLASIPVESCTTPFQMVQLLCTSSELGFIRNRASPTERTSLLTARLGSRITYSALPFLDFEATGTTQNTKVAEAREFVVSRLSISQRQMPGQRLFKLLQGLREVWSRLDEGKTSEPVYWLDVITEMR